MAALTGIPEGDGRGAAGAAGCIEGLCSLHSRDMAKRFRGFRGDDIA